MIIACCFRVAAPSGNAALALSQSGIAPELNRIQLSAICRGGQSGKVIDLLAWRCLPLGHPSAASGACAVEQISSSKGINATSGKLVWNQHYSSQRPRRFALALSPAPSGIAPELNRIQLSAICHGGQNQSGKVIDLLPIGMTLLAAWSSFCGKWRLPSCTKITTKAASGKLKGFRLASRFAANAAWPSFWQSCSSDRAATLKQQVMITQHSGKAAS